MIPTDVGAYLETFNAQDPAVITAGAGNDGVAVDGNVCDRSALHAGQMPQSAKLVINYKAVLASSETLSITATLKHCATSGGTYAALTALRGRHVKSDGTITAITLSSGAIPATVVATGSATLRGTVELDVPLSIANQYLRSTVTANLSASGTDTVALSAVLVLGGSDVCPA
jgi:hypothetical protein